MGIRPSGTVRTMVRLRGSTAPVGSMPKIRLLLPALVFLALLAFGAGNAAAKAPCWKTLLNDWFDGRIEGTYPVHCYRDAIKHLPEDIKDYSQARDDLSRALLSAILTNGRNGGPPLGPNSLIPGEPTRSTQGRKKDESFWERVANKLGPGNATSIPLPLMILAGVGLLLVAGAGASVAARRIQARRDQPQTTPPAPTDRRK
jgi:hypothetical protein